MSSAPGMTERAFGNIALLVAFVLVLFAAAIARYRPNPEIDAGG